MNRNRITKYFPLLAAPQDDIPQLVEDNHNWAEESATVIAATVVCRVLGSIALAAGALSAWWILWAVAGHAIKFVWSL